MTRLGVASRACFWDLTRRHIELRRMPQDVLRYAAKGIDARLQVQQRREWSGSLSLCEWWHQKCTYNLIDLYMHIRNTFECRSLKLQRCTQKIVTLRSSWRGRQDADNVSWRPKRCQHYVWRRARNFVLWFPMVWESTSFQGAKENKQIYLKFWKFCFIILVIYVVIWNFIWWYIGK